MSAKSAESDKGGAARVLIVDDNPLNVEMATYLLHDAGMRVAFALDAQTAREQVVAFEPDLVLMDMQLPGTDGLALTRELRSKPSPRPMAIVAFTAYAMTGDREKFLTAGCNGYLAKPIDVMSFAADVHALLPSRG